MKIIGDTLILDNGKKFNVNDGIVGLDPEHKCLYGGFDDSHDRSLWGGEVIITNEDWNEICDYMSNAWKEAKVK